MPSLYAGAAGDVTLAAEPKSPHSLERSPAELLSGLFTLASFSDPLVNCRMFFPPSFFPSPQRNATCFRMPNSASPHPSSSPATFIREQEVAWSATFIPTCLSLSFSLLYFTFSFSFLRLHLIQRGPGNIGLLVALLSAGNLLHLSQEQGHIALHRLRSWGAVQHQCGSGQRHPKPKFSMGFRHLLGYPPQATDQNRRIWFGNTYVSRPHSPPDPSTQLKHCL